MTHPREPAPDQAASSGERDRGTLDPDHQAHEALRWLSRVLARHFARKILLEQGPHTAPTPNGILTNDSNS
jgi:hypothetical protein